MKFHKSFWAFLILTIVFTAVALELSKNQLFGWILAAALFVGFVFLSGKVMYQTKWWAWLLTWIGLIVLLFGVGKLSAPPYRAIPAVDVKNPELTGIITVSEGRIQGVYNKDKTVEVYTGIPYAKPPVGELRWKAPEDPEAWEGVRVCDHFQPMSMQKRNPVWFDTLSDLVVYHHFEISLKDNYKEPVSEDSLYLNVWKPSGEQEGLPVLVYIHGGSLTGGQPWWSEYRGEDVAAQGVIVVDFAYRLNVFGYLATEDLAAESPNHTTGNYGLMDQIKAVEWVKKNIAAFGGDPERITIAGESAGSSSVQGLCVSPLAEGLFHQAIGESSGIAAVKPYHTFRTLESALQMGSNILAEFGCANADELRQVPAEQLVNTRYTNSAMTVDGYVITEQPYLTYEKGENNETALLNGSNIHEADLFLMTSKVTKENIEDYASGVLGEYADEAIELLGIYPQDKAYKPLIDLGGDAKGTFDTIYSAAWFGYSHEVWSRYLAGQGHPVYQYYFTKDNGCLGSMHGGELPYFYHNLDSHPSAYHESDEALSQIMMAYYVNFIKTGDPNGKGFDGSTLPEWKTYSEAGGELMELGDNVGMIPNPNKNLYDLIDRYQETLK